MSKKVKILYWAIIAIGVVVSFVITARDALFGDASFSEIGWGWLVSSVVSLVFISIMIFVFVLGGAKRKD